MSTKRTGRLLGFSALEISELRAWLDAELRLVRRARERGVVPDSVFERILLLLALADSPNVHEARAAELKATELMARYGIDVADLAAFQRQRRA